MYDDIIPHRLELRNIMYSVQKNDDDKTTLYVEKNIKGFLKKCARKMNKAASEGKQSVLVYKCGFGNTTALCKKAKEHLQDKDYTVWEGPFPSSIRISW